MRIATHVTCGSLLVLNYGLNFAALFAHAAEVVDKILRGTNPGDIPVEQPTKFDFASNLKTAKLLGFDVPYSMQLLGVE